MEEKESIADIYEEEANVAPRFSESNPWNQWRIQEFILVGVEIK
jgi:hypothetical protein